jgi:hypothetical protein
MANLVPRSRGSMGGYPCHEEFHDALGAVAAIERLRPACCDIKCALAGRLGPRSSYGHLRSVKHAERRSAFHQQGVRLAIDNTTYP